METMSSAFKLGAGTSSLLLELTTSVIKSGEGISRSLPSSSVTLC